MQFVSAYFLLENHVCNKLIGTLSKAYSQDLMYHVTSENEILQ